MLPTLVPEAMEAARDEAARALIGHGESEAAALVGLGMTDSVVERMLHDGYGPTPDTVVS